MYPAKYTVEIWVPDETDNPVRVSGITFGENFTEVMSNIESYYGDELLTVYIELQEEAPVYELEMEDK